MSMYAMAAQEGLRGISMLATGDKATYNAVYASEAQRFVAEQAKLSAENNIAAIRQDKILSDVQIEMKQSQLEAQARVNAATAGVSGQNVDQVIYLSEANESLEKYANEQTALQAVADQSTAIENAQRAFNNVPRVNVTSAADMLIRGVGSLDKGDMSELKELWSK